MFRRSWTSTFVLARDADRLAIINIEILHPKTTILWYFSLKTSPKTPSIFFSCPHLLPSLIPVSPSLLLSPITPGLSMTDNSSHCDSDSWVCVGPHKTVRAEQSCTHPPPPSACIGYNHCLNHLRLTARQLVGQIEEIPQGTPMWLDLGKTIGVLGTCLIVIWHLHTGPVTHCFHKNDI